MNRLTYSICVLIFSITSVFSQNNSDAEHVISDFIGKLKSATIVTNFNLKVSEKNSVNSHLNSGSFILRANKFVLEMDAMKVWFDGKTQWAFLTKSNEVTISEPTDNELAQTNPLAILSAYKIKSLIRFSKTVSDKNYIIDLTPKDKKSDFVKIEVQINKASGNLVSMKMSNKNGQLINLIITGFRRDSKVAEEDFVFHPSKFKGVNINDIR